MNQERKEHILQTLDFYVPVVDRVHGPHHPEFHDVKRLYEDIRQKLNHDMDVSNEFEEIRTISSNYEVPGDVCETYEAVYNLLAELDHGILG